MTVNEGWTSCTYMMLHLQKVFFCVLHVTVNVSDLRRKFTTQLRSISIQSPKLLTANYTSKIFICFEEKQKNYQRSGWQISMWSTGTIEALLTLTKKTILPKSICHRNRKNKNAPIKGHSDFLESGKHFGIQTLDLADFTFHHNGMTGCDTEKCQIVVNVDHTAVAKFLLSAIEYGLDKYGTVQCACGGVENGNR